MHITDIELTSTTLQTEAFHEDFPQIAIRSKTNYKLKGFLFLIFIFLAIFGDSKFNVYANLILFLLMIIISHRIKSDCILISIAIIITIISIFLQNPILFYAQFLISLTVLTFQFSIRMLRESKLVFIEIKNLSLTMLFVTIFAAYLTTSYYKDNIKAVAYFSTFGRSILTLVQSLTLDDWGQIGRETDDLFGYLLLCIYIMLMTYFYINIMMGLIIDTLQNDKKGIQNEEDPFNYESTQQKLYSDIAKVRSKLDSLIIGKYYEYIVFVITFGSVILTILNNFDAADTDLEKMLGLIDDIVYTMHFCLLLVLKGPIYEIERKSFVMMSLHFIAGPLSFIFTIFFDLQVGCLLNLFKVATTPSIKGICRGTIRILPMLVPQFIELMGILMFISSILTSQYFYHEGPKKQLYFNSFWGSVYTMIQIMTLDDWGTIVEPMWDKYQTITPYFIVPAYIILSNFIILNTLIALSCEYFVEIKYILVDRFDKEHLREKNKIQSISKIQEYCDQNNLKLRIPQVIVNQNDEFERKLMANEVFEIIYKDLIITVQSIQQTDAL